jgi:hypothetical protein
MIDAPAITELHEQADAAFPAARPDAPGETDDPR